MSAGRDNTEPARRVLLVSHYFPPHVGGIENVVEGEAIHLAKAGHEVTVLTTAVGARAGVLYTPEGYSVVRLRTWNGIERRTGIPFPVPAPWTLWTGAKLIRNTDVVHVHDIFYLTTWLAALAARLRGRPLVLTQHVQLIAHPRRIVQAIQRLVYATIGRIVVRSAARIAVINSGVGEFLQTLGARADRIVLVPNGIDTDRFHPATAEDKPRLRRSLQLPERGVLALFVGRFVPKKGYDKLLQATGDNYTLVLAGGPTPPGFADRAGLIFMGCRTQNQLADLYRACDLFVLPSESEGFPLTVQEAMASGLPVITSDDPGYGIYRLDRDRVAFIRPTVPEISSALQRLAVDDALRQRMARYSSSIAAARFSWLEHVKSVEQMYDAAVSLSGKPRHEQG
jgi:glycosyltransferase involved in cell wall biosynthesis